MDTKQYFDCLCRTCMNEIGVSSYKGCNKSQQQWLTIFDIIEECGTLRIAELLSNTVPQIVVNLSDELPKKICSECLQQLLNVYRFQQMCVQSEKEMHDLLSKTQSYLEIEREIDKNDADSYPLKNLTCTSTHQNLQNSSIQKRLPEAIEQTIELVASQSSAANHLQNNDQLREHCKDLQGECTESIKHEPIEEEQSTIEDSDDNTIHSILSVTKEEGGLSIEPEEQQMTVTKANSNELCHACDECGVTFIEQRYLIKHLREQHSIDKPHKCDFCEKRFKDSTKLRLHKRTHTDERPYSCPECGKSFKMASHLRRHRATHADDKPYECPYCPLRFRSNENIARHKKSHEGMDQEACDICGKNVRKSSLKQHKLIHSGEKPHKCEFCPKSFSHIQPLQAHIRTHTGEKPYKCKYCELAFATNNVLMRHLRIHLGDNIHSCELCPLAFPSAAEQRLHFTTHKNEDLETRERNMKALSESEAKLRLQISKANNQQLSTEELQPQLEIRIR